MTDVNQRLRRTQLPRSTAANPEVNKARANGTFDVSNPKDDAKASPADLVPEPQQPVQPSTYGGTQEEFRTCFTMGSWFPSDPAPEPNPEILLDAIMCRLMADPYSSLDPMHNGSLMRVFESYRHLSDNERRSKQRAEAAKQGHGCDSEASRVALSEVEEELISYKKEVKRLEIIISKSKQGVAAVTKARQDSLIKKREKSRKDDTKPEDDKESVIRLLEKSRLFDDRGWSTQRATMRQRPVSPSQQMRRLSKTLSKDSSRMRANVNLPLGTPPELDRSALADAMGAKSRTFKRLSENHVGHGVDSIELQPQHSEESSSTLSATELLLHDGLLQHNERPDGDLDPDFAAIQRLAERLCLKRGIDYQDLSRRLTELFAAPDRADDDRAISPRSSTSPIITPSSMSLMGEKYIQHGSILGPKHHRLRLKASGIMQKLRAQSSTDSLTDSLSRRFSFEPGDDIALSNVWHKGDTSRAAHSRAVRKSMSLTSLDDTARRQARQRVTLSPVPASPTASASSQGKYGSIIPSSPPQQDKLVPTMETTENLVPDRLTAMRHNQGVPQQCGSPPRLSWSAPVAQTARAERALVAGLSESTGPQLTS